jgi:hypothetical protein
MLKLLSRVMGGKKSKVAVIAAAMMVFGATSAFAADPIDFTGVTLPFNVPDMLTTAVGFLTMYGQWILLALGVIFAPVLYGLAIRLISAARRRSQSN